MSKPAGPALAPAQPAVASDARAADPPPICVQITVWTRSGWQARAEWGEGQGRLFDSPFELARFLANPPAPPTPPAAGVSGGLR
jgi:hypothetical protein